MKTLRQLSFALGFMGMAWLCAASEAAEVRAPVPAGPDLERAQATIRDLYKADFAKTKAADRIALAAKLFQEALETKNDPAAKFALLREARDLAAKSGDAAGVLRATDEMTAHFVLKPGEAIAPALDPLVGSTNVAATSMQIAHVLLVAADEARFAGEWNVSLTILKAAGAAAAKATGAATSERVRAKVKDTEAGRAEFEKAKDALEAVKTKPTDPAVCLAAGRYLAFFQQEWNEGIELLAKGADEKLQVAAQRDLKAVSGNDEDRIAAADGWYDFAASADASVKPAMQIRAHYWYVAAFPSQAGINKTRVEKRIAELQPIVDAKADKTALWTAVRRGVGDARLKKWQIVGGAFSEKTFEEMPPGGGLLVGFHYTTTQTGRFPHVVQPIYLTPFGEVLGGGYGTIGKGDSAKMTAKAKPGYAVGAIQVRGGGGFDAFKPIFMRITEAGLNPKDSYDGPHIGGMGGSEGTVGGDGNFIVGLHGKINEKTGKIEAMSAISLTLGDPVKPPPKKKKKP